MAPSEHERPVHTLPADSAYESVRVGVRLRCPNGVLMTSMPSEMKTSSKIALNLASRSRMRNFRAERVSPALMHRLRARWVTQGPVGFAVTPAMWTLLVSSSMKKSTRTMTNGVAN